jgi:hypothetical protein
MRQKEGEMETKTNDEPKLKPGQRKRPFSEAGSPNAGKIMFSRNGAVYTVQANGSMKRLKPNEQKAVYDELAANPVQKECGAMLHFFYCAECGVSRHEPCKRLKERLI